MNVMFNELQLGQSYDRLFLAKLWEYENSQPIKRGVITPKDTNTIILFVTKEKQKSATQYNDFLDGDLLFWEGAKVGIICLWSHPHPNRRPPKNPPKWQKPTKNWPN
jgi:hypothetical protein